MILSVCVLSTRVLSMYVFLWKSRWVHYMIVSLESGCMGLAIKRDPLDGDVSFGASYTTANDAQPTLQQ